MEALAGAEKADRREMAMEGVIQGWSERPHISACFCKICSCLPCPASRFWSL